jgi:fumarate hydratase class I
MTENYIHHEMFPLGADTTPYRLLTSEHVGTRQVDGREILEVDTRALTLLADQAMRDCQHLLRPSHLTQLRRIIDDPEASANDRFVAFELLKNANIAAAGILPMCQDTGTAIVMAKKGENVWTSGDDEAALSQGILKAYSESNLRYSQVAPLDMFNEKNTGTNLPAQIDLSPSRATRISSCSWRRGAARPTRATSTRRRRRC